MNLMKQDSRLCVNFETVKLSAMSQSEFSLPAAGLNETEKCLNRLVPIPAILLRNADKQQTM